MGFSEKPVINNEVVALYETTKKWTKERVTQAVEKIKNDPNFSIIQLFFIVILTGIVFYVFSTYYNVLENPTNISRIARESIDAESHYGNDNHKRIGIRDYLQQLKNSGVPTNHFVLTNFYVSTVNAGGLFYPIVDGVVSPEAARAAVLGGARSFVFDIWPDMTPGAQFGPVIQTVESGSLWRRVSINALPFSYVLKVLAEEAFAFQSRPGYYDPLFIYLRFRGKPRMDTFNLTARAISAALEEHRLPSSFNACRNQDQVFALPISDILRKVIIASNMKAESSSLRDYINVGPKAGVKLEWGINEARGLNAEALPQAKRLVQQNLAWIAPLSEDQAAVDNEWDTKPSFDIGIMFCAMNFGNTNEKLGAYLSDDWFGKQSFKIKPEPLRYVIDVLPNPLDPPNPGWKSSPSAGTPISPPGITLP